MQSSEYTIYSYANNTVVVLALSSSPVPIDRYGDPPQINYSIESYLKSRDELLTTPIFVHVNIQQCPLGFQLKGNPPCLSV